MNWLAASGRFRRAVRFAAAGTAAAVAVTIGSAAEPERAVAAPKAAAQKAKPVSSRPDLVSAQISARAQGSRVEVEALRRETSTTWVNPDGTLTTEEHAGPIRFKNATGEWQDVDLDFAELPDGSVAPKGHPLGLSLSGASSAPEADLAGAEEKKGKRKQAREVTLGWSGRLPKPVLKGTTATYAEVQPGVDLVIESRRTGFEQHLVVKSAEALAGLMRAKQASQPVSWTLPVKTAGLTARAEKDGSVSFLDADGQTASRFAAPMAWDATVDERSGEHTSVSPVKLTVSQKGNGRALLTLTPDQKWLTSPDRIFPVTIDPTYASGTVTANFDTYVSKAYPSATYSTSTELKVGTYNGGGDVARSYLSFPLASFGGKQIQSASLSLYEFHSWSCTAKPFYSYGTAGQPSSSTNWSNQPGQGSNYGTTTIAKGYSSTCADGRVSISVLGAVQYWSSHASGSGSIKLAASETDNYGWKKFYSLESSQDPYITYTYNRKPNAASTPTLQSPPGVSYVNPSSGVTYLYTSDATPQFTTKATDPDGSTLQYTVEVHSSTTASSTTLKASCVTSGFTASGSSASCSSTTALADNAVYYARVAVKDDKGLWNGTWSPWTTFRTAIAAPPAPKVSCPSPYTDGSWADSVPASGVSCTITAAGTGTTAPAYIQYSLDGAAYVKKAITPSSDPAVAKISVTVPNTGGAHALRAYAQSVTSLNSGTTSYGFGYGSASLSQPTVSPRVTTTGSVKITAGGPPVGASTKPTAKVRWRVASSGTDETTPYWNDATSTALTVTDNGTNGVSVTGSWNAMAETSDATLDSDAGTDGVQATSLNPRVPVLLDVQVCLAYTTGTQCTWSQSKTSVMRLPHAFGNGFPTADAGPGQVALFTGEFNTDITDVTIPGYTGALSLSRSHSTYGNSPSAPTDAVTGIFGPGWTASLEGSEAGLAGMQAVDSTRADGTISFIDAERCGDGHRRRGTIIRFRASGIGGLRSRVRQNESELTTSPPLRVEIA